jgi:hypothetical protein
MYKETIVLRGVISIREENYMGISVVMPLVCIADIQGVST